MYSDKPEMYPADYIQAAPKLFIGALAVHTGENSLKAYFEQFGDLSDCVVMVDRAKNKSRCFGFVTFRDPWIADQVTCMSHILDGKAIDVKKAVPKSESYSDVVNFDQNFVTNKVFVGGIPLHADENDIKRTIIRDKFSKQSRGFGFVEFTDTRAVDRIMQDYFSISVLGKWVECKKALPRHNYPNNITVMMRGAKRMRFDKETDDASPSQEEIRCVEEMPLREACMNQLMNVAPEMSRPKAQLLPRVSQQNFAPTRVNIDLEASFAHEDKENYIQRNPMLVHQKENYYGSIDVGYEDIKAKPSDPRKGKILELKNKSKFNLQAQRDQRSFNVF